MHCISTSRLHLCDMNSAWLHVYNMRIWWLHEDFKKSWICWLAQLDKKDHLFAGFFVLTIQLFFKLCLKVEPLWTFLQRHLFLSFEVHKRSYVPICEFSTSKPTLTLMVTSNVLHQQKFLFVLWLLSSEWPASITVLHLDVVIIFTVKQLHSWKFFDL